MMNNLVDYIIQLETANSQLSLMATRALDEAQRLHLENISLRNQLGGPERLQPTDEALYRDIAQFKAWGGSNV